MKKKIIKVIAIYGLIILMGSGCTKDDPYTWSDYIEGYVVGTFMGQLEQNNNKSTPVGYCILLAKNNDSICIMNFYAFNLPGHILNIPEELIYRRCNCGPRFFADSLKRKYKIRFQYSYVSENEKKRFECGPCSGFPPAFPWEKYPEIILKNLTKVEK